MGISFLHHLEGFSIGLSAAYEGVGYYRDSKTVDNSGLILGLNLSGKNLPAFRFGIEERKATSLRRGTVTTAASVFKGGLEVEVNYEDEEFALGESADRKRKATGDLKLTQSFKLSPFTLELRVLSSLLFYDRKREYLSNRWERMGSLGFALKGTMDKFNLLFDFENGMGFNDYRNFEGDEGVLRRNAKVEISFPFLGLTIESGGDVSLMRYTYPQGLRLDDRDLRSIKGFLKATKVLSRAFVISGAYSYSRKDMVYVKSARSYNSRKNEEYRLGFDIEGRKPLWIRANWGIVALYSVYRFESSKNLLVRYLDADLKAGYPDSSGVLVIDVRSRLQDQGGYREVDGTWYFIRRQKSRELWMYPSLRLVELSDWSFYFDGGFYERLSGPVNVPLSLSASEKWLGFRVEGRGLQAYYRRHRRGDEVFSSFSISIERKF